MDVAMNRMRSPVVLFKFVRLISFSRMDESIQVDSRGKQVNEARGGCQRPKEPSRAKRSAARLGLPL